MQRKTILFALCAFALATPTPGIAGPSISTQAAPGANFSAYKTYSWVQAQIPAGGNPITYQQIMIS